MDALRFAGMFRAEVEPVDDCAHAFRRVESCAHVHVRLDRGAFCHTDVTRVGEVTSHLITSLIHSLLASALCGPPSD